MKNIFLLILVLFIVCCEKEEFDYRNELVGNYYCRHTYNSWMLDDTSNNMRVAFDTLIVSKVNENELQILNHIFVLDSNLKYLEHFGGSSYTKVEFFPEFDSIYYYKSSGGLGGGMYNSYEGSKKGLAPQKGFEKIKLEQYPQTSATRKYDWLKEHYDAFPEVIKELIHRFVF